MIEILSSTPLATVQDLGRDRHFRFAVSLCGAMDRLALAVGNVLLGNPEDAAGIESPLLPFQVRFRSDTTFAVTGASCEVDLDGVKVPPWWAMPARGGQVLSLNAPVDGVRVYLLVAGGIEVPVVLGSRSTQLRGEFGGYFGRMLREGDVLETGNADDQAACSPSLPEAGFGVESPAQALPAVGDAENIGDNVTVLRVLPAAETGYFDQDSLESFWHAVWKITPQSNRIGYRLDGPSLRLKRNVEMRSHGIVPGIIQVPSGGAPIIQLADSQTSGGYPKIGTVIEADLWRIGQAKLGSKLRFLQTSYAEALEARDQARVYLDKVRSLAAVYHEFRQKTGRKIRAGGEG